MKTGLQFVDFLLLTWLLFVWFWDFPEDGPLYGRLRKFIRPFIEYIGMGHSWKLYADGEWTKFHRLLIRLVKADGTTIDRKFKGVSEILWSWNTIQDKVHCRNTLKYFLRKTPDAESAELVFLTQNRPKPEAGILGRLPLPLENAWQAEVLCQVDRREVRKP